MYPAWLQVVTNSVLVSSSLRCLHAVQTPSAGFAPFVESQPCLPGGAKSCVQGLGSVHQWKVAQAGPKDLNMITMSLILTAGFAIMVYLGDVLEEHGIGDGISFVICMGIVTGEHYC